MKYDLILQPDARSSRMTLLNKHHMWQDLWLMNFNPSKCEVLTVTRKKLPIVFNYTMHALILNRVKDTKYLGVSITSDINWNKHINQVTGDPHTEVAVQRSEMVQRRAARYVMRRYHNTSSISDMMEHLQWPTLAQRRCCLRLTMLLKI